MNKSDVVNKNMSHIRSQDTSIELQLRRALRKKGYYYRKNFDKLPGSPDIVLPKYKIVVFCDSEFFHGKDWDVLKARLEKGANPRYWVRKIERNMSRDSEVDRQLIYRGWTVIHFWGRDIMKKTDECIKVIEETIFNLKMECEEASYCHSHRI